MASQETPTAPNLWLVLAKAHRAVGQRAEESVAASGIGTTDFMVLEALLHKGPLTITEIQSKVLLATGSMTAAVDRVEKKGLVVRKTTPDDRRARLIHLTDEGRALIECVFKRHSEDLEEVTSVLDAEEKRQLYGLLKKLGLFAAGDPHQRSGTKGASDDTSTQE